MKNFIEIRPPGGAYGAPNRQVARALSTSQNQPNNETFSKKNNLQITNEAFSRISKKTEKIILRDANCYGKIQQEQFSRAQRNLAIAALMRTGEIRQITADDLLRHAQNLRDAKNGKTSAFALIGRKS